MSLSLEFMNKNFVFAKLSIFRQLLSYPFRHDVTQLKLKYWLAMDYWSYMKFPSWWFSPPWNSHPLHSKHFAKDNFCSLFLLVSVPSDVVVQFKFKSFFAVFRIFHSLQWLLGIFITFGMIVLILCYFCTLGSFNFITNCVLRIFK